MDFHPWAFEFFIQAVSILPFLPKKSR
uniref:Uncharacterized protein n=1 Tax=Vitis vinifera TaxID=29760 RepID=F6GVE6_VITVI